MNQFSPADSDNSDAGREAYLLAELQHRVRNTLATTRMIARRSAETSKSLDDYVAHLDGRLAALARVQNAAIRDPLTGIDLGLIIADELTSAGQGTSSHARIDGPTVLLHPRAAETFALALHELATNAIKFGALSPTAGRLSVIWIVDHLSGQPSHLTLDWFEDGLQLDPVAQRREGFGTMVLTSMLKHNLGASTKLTFAATGVRYRISVPLGGRILARGQLFGSSLS